MNPIYSAIYQLQEITLLTWRAIRSLVRPPLYWSEMLRQMDVLGFGSLAIILLTGTFTGGVLALNGVSLDIAKGQFVSVLGANGVLPEPLPRRPVCTCSSGARRQCSISHVVLVEGTRIPKCRGMASVLPREIARP